MAENSKIGWTDHTINFWMGCTKVSEECRNCYIKGVLGRMSKTSEPFGGPKRTAESTWKKAWTLNQTAIKANRRDRVFTCSLSDFFHPEADCWRADAWQVIRDCKQLDWLILSKRPQLIADRLPSDWEQGYQNVSLGVTAGCRDSSWRLDELAKIPAACRFISAEPLLERLDLRPYLADFDWVITGCEQAARDKRRRMELDWVRNIDSQCREAGVAHFFKQYYATMEGKEFGLPCEDGMLDARHVQEFPNVLVH